MTTKEIRLGLVLKCAKLGFWDFQPNDEELNWSETGKMFFGINRDEEVTYAKLLAGLHPDDRERVDQTLQQVLAGEKRNYELEFRTIGLNDRVERVVHACGETQVDDSGKPSRLIGVSKDVTEERNQHERALADLKQAEATNRAKTQFVANVSHEMRTPLGVMLGFADLALEEDLSPDEAKQYLQTIINNGNDLLKLINEVLDLSKVEANKMEIEERKFNLSDALHQTVSSMKARASAKGLKLTLASDGRIPTTVSADSSRLRQILMNLISNAIKFTDDGEIKIRVRVREPLELGKRIFLEIDVSDTGIGIPETARVKVFEPFVQADPSTTRKYGGTGLGLSISRKLAEAMGGSLELIDSTGNDGTCFRLRFTDGVYTSDLQFTEITNLSIGAARSNVERRPHVDLKGIKVSLVEDAVDNQMLVSRFLEAAGADIEIAENGIEAIDLAMAHDYDVVLMDLQMPEMDGYTATERLREQGYAQPIVALTAHAMQGEKARCLSLGFSDHMTKPINRHDLLNEVALMTRRLHS